MSRLHLAEIRNPMRPSEITRTELEFVPGRSLEDLYPQLVTQELVIALNGKIIDKTDRARTFPQEGDYMTICPVIAGGDSGKQILRIVALIAVAVIAPQLGALYGSFAGATLGIGVAGWTTIFTVAGGLLVNALLPPPKPPEQASSSPTYGIDGAKNTSAEGIAVPIVYGKFRYAGNIINNYTVNDGDSQWLYMLLNAGEGPIASIDEDSIELNEVALSQFKDKDTEVRLGTGTQEPIPWFTQTISPKNVGHQLTETSHVVATNGAVDRIRLDFTAPAGLNKTEDGKAYSYTVPLLIEHRKLPSGSWQPLPFSTSVTGYSYQTTWSQVPTSFDADGQPNAWTTYVPDTSEVLEGNEYVIYPVTGGDSPIRQVVGVRKVVAVYEGGDFNMTGKSTTAVRRSITSGPLEEGNYEVRVKRIGAEHTNPASGITDIIIWSDLNEITNEVVAYRHTALLGLKIRLTDQLNSIPTVSYMHGGKVISVWNEDAQAWDYEASSNPAWIALDILTNKRYGGGAAMSRFDLAKWREWAKYCNDPYGDASGRKLEFNGVFDTQTNVWDAVMQVMRCGHAQLVRVGTRYSVAIERAEDPVMMFSMGNIVQGSFKESWMAMTDRANEIEGTYYDKLDKYKQRTIRVYDSNAVAAGRPQRVTQVDLRGVTDAQQAWDDLNIILNINRYLQRTINFSAPMDALACTVGDVILVQHDMPLWGVGGRLASASTDTTLNLDREVTLEHGKAYKALVQHSSIQRYSGTITSHSVVGDQTFLALSGFDLTKKVSRIVYSGKDYAIAGTGTSGLASGVFLNELVTPVGGTAYVIFETDVIDTRDVVNPATIGSPVTTSSLTLSTGLSAAPKEFTNFMFGENLKVAKPFRIKSISGSHEYTRDIVALEYNASVYDPAGAVPTPNYSALPLGVEHATISGVSEVLDQHGLSYKSLVTVFFNSEQLTYRGSNVYLSRNGAPFEWIGRDRYSVTVDAAQSDVLIFRVVAFDVLGKSAPESTAPEETYTVLGKVIPPNALTNVGYTVTESGIEFKFDPPADQDWLTTQAALTNDFATPIFDAKVTSFLWGFQTFGVYSVYFRHFVQGYLPSAPVSVPVTILAPNAPTITSTTVVGKTVMMKWLDAKTTQPIKHYVVKIGDVGQAFVDATEVLLAPRTQNAASILVDAIGTKRIFIQAVDRAGNVGPVATSDVTTTSPTVNALTLTSTSQIFSVAPGGATISPANITFVASMSGALVGQVATFSTSPTVPLTVVGNTCTLSAGGMGTNQSVAVTATVTIGPDTYSDTITVVRLESGSDAISFVLSNEATVVPADADGTVLDFTGANTYMTIYRGVIDDTTNWTFTKKDTNVSSTIVDGLVSVTAWTGLVDEDLNFTDILNTTPPGFAELVLLPMSGDADIGYVDIIATRAGYQPQLKRFTVTKARAGTGGSSAKTAYLSASSQIFKIAKNDGTATPSSILLTALGQNVTGSPTFTVTSGDATLTGTGETRTLDYEDMVSDLVTIGITWDGVGDSITILKLREGDDALNGVLSNEAHVVSADSAGTVGSFAGAGGTFQVYLGATDLTGTGAVTYSVVSETGVDISIGSDGIYTVTSMSADTGSAVLRATVGTTSVDKVYTIAKSKSGTPGSAGAAGPRGNVNIVFATSGSVWSNAEAVSALSSSGYGAPQLRDIVTLHNSGSGYSETRFYDGTNWLVVTQYLNGNLFVTGTVTGDKLVANTVTTEKLQIGAATASVSSQYNSFTLTDQSTTTDYFQSNVSLLTHVLGTSHSSVAVQGDMRLNVLVNPSLPAGEYTVEGLVQFTLVGQEYADPLYDPNFQVGSQNINYRRQFHGGGGLTLNFPVSYILPRSAMPPAWVQGHEIEILYYVNFAIYDASANLVAWESGSSLNLSGRLGINELKV